MVQAWYQGGLSMFDFTDSAHPVEIAFFDRGPIDANSLIVGGYWSTYWYNGHIYGSEIARGIDIFKLLPSEFMSQNEIDAASLVRMDEFNAQEQPKMTWPANVVVARAYPRSVESQQGDQRRPAPRRSSRRWTRPRRTRRTRSRSISSTPWRSRWSRTLRRRADPTPPGSSRWRRR